jgi:hypothetical protein
MTIMENTMPEIRTVTGVAAETLGSDLVPCWRVQTTDGGGLIHEVLMPQTTLAWRAAEYGIDPADTTTLLDVILHEPFLPDLDDPDAAAADPAAKAGMTVPARQAHGRTRKGDPEPVRLRNALTIADARTAHLMRIAAIKDTVRVDTPGGKGASNPLQQIHDTPVDPALVAKLAGRVDQARRRYRGERIPRNPQPDLPVDDTVQRRARAMKETGRA